MFSNADPRSYLRLGTSYEPLFVVLTGSYLYGLHTKTSDKDYRGVYANTPQSILGLFEEKRSIDIKNGADEDVTFWSIKHFLRMCLNNNPNVIEILFAPDSHFKYLTENPFEVQCIENLRGEKNRFLSPSLITSAISFARNELVEASAGAGVKLNKDLNPEMFYTPLEDKTKASKKLAHVLRLLNRVDQVVHTGTFSPVLTGVVLDRILKVRQGEWNYVQILQEFKRYQSEEQTLIRLAKQHIPDYLKSEAWADKWLIRFNTERFK